MDVEDENVYLDSKTALKTLQEKQIFSRYKDELQMEIFNKYALHKSVSQNLLNTSVIQSHIGTLVYILSNDIDNKGFEIAEISLISLSLTLQIFIFFALVWLTYRRQDYTSSFLSSEQINILVTYMSGITLIINIAITAISLEIIPVKSENM